MNLQEAINQMFMGKYIVNDEIGDADYYYIEDGILYAYDNDLDGKYEAMLTLSEILSLDYRVVDYLDIYK